jgi:hypothetical protein
MGVQNVRWEIAVSIVGQSQARASEAKRDYCRNL